MRNLLFLVLRKLQVFARLQLLIDLITSNDLVGVRVVRRARRAGDLWDFGVVFLLLVLVFVSVNVSYESEIV